MKPIITIRSDYHHWALVNLSEDVQPGFMARTRSQLIIDIEAAFGDSWRTLYRRGFRITRVEVMINVWTDTYFKVSK